MIEKRFSKLKSILIEHEGKRNYPYKDSLGTLTIGVGRNISESGIGLRDIEISFMLENDIEYFSKELEKHNFYKIQDDVRKEVLIELAFNLGIKGILKFVHMISAFERMDYETAKKELLNSSWAHQVSRERLSNILSRVLNGEY